MPALADLAENPQAFLKPGPAIGRQRCVRLALSKDALKTNGPGDLANAAAPCGCTCSSLSMTHGPAIRASGAPFAKVTAELNRHASTFGVRVLARSRASPCGACAASRCFSAAPMNAVNSGCGSSGFDLNSGWNWQPRNQGWSAISQIST